MKPSLPDVKRSQDVLRRFGARLRILRKDHGWSQEDFALVCGLDRTYIGGIERGERNVSLRNIDLIARALQVSMMELLRDI